MQPRVAETWKLVRRDGMLADLPAMAEVDQGTVKPQNALFQPVYYHFRFSAPRAAVHQWLTASMTEETRKACAKRLTWPEGQFSQRYEVGLRCLIAVFCADGKKAQVLISKAPTTPPPAPNREVPRVPREMAEAAPRDLTGAVEGPDPDARPFWVQLKREPMIVIDPYRAETEKLRQLLAQQRDRADKTLLMNLPEGL